MTDLLPNRLVLLLLAAATAAILLLPVALRGDRAGAPGPQSDPSPAETSYSPTEPEPERAVLDRRQADIDADGELDEVLLSKDPAPGEGEPTVGLVEVILANGEKGSAAVPFGYFRTLEPPADINRDGRHQVLLIHTQGGDGAVLLAYGWQDAGLVPLWDRADPPPGTSMYGGYQFSGFYFENGQLLSWARLDARDVHGKPIEVNVDTWSWSIQGDRLVDSPVGRACKDLTTVDPPRPCA